MKACTKISFALSLILISPALAYATAIIYVVKGGAIYIGSDGLRHGTNIYQSVCKVHEAYGGVLSKWGMDTDPDLTFSMDKDVSRLVKEKRSFKGFQSAAAIILQRRVASSTEEFLIHIRSVHPEAFFDDGTLKVKPTEQDAWRVEMGLVFVGISAGKLAVQVLQVSPIVHEVSEANGLTGYRWIVDKPEWQTKLEKVFEYPPSAQLSDPTLEARLVQDPDTQIMQTLRNIAAIPQLSCTVGEPMSLTKVTISTGKHKKAVVQYLEPGACPSWESLPILPPEKCTPVGEIVRP